jgi:aldose 1-epimerase
MPSDHQPPRLIKITAGESCATLLPGAGGCIAGWTVNGQPMLRQSNADQIAAGSPLGLSSFPLVPFSNRIGDARFDWQGREIAITPNFTPETHAIHGTGWEDSWQVEALGDDTVTLALDHPGDPSWRWAFSARQCFTVTPSALILTLSARNLAQEAAPLAFGHHPYFDAADASLSFGARYVWMNGDDMRPTEQQRPEGMFDFSTGGSLDGRMIDHCYAGWDGQAQINWAGRKLALHIASTLPAAVVYIPEGEDYFCFEPVPHSNNALNRPDADPPMPVIAPGDMFQATICFTVSA